MFINYLPWQVGNAERATQVWVVIAQQCSRSLEIGLRGPRSRLHPCHRCIPLQWVPWVRLGQQSKDWRAKIQDLQARALRDRLQGLRGTLSSQWCFLQGSPTFTSSLVTSVEHKLHFCFTVLVPIRRPWSRISKLSDFLTHVCPQGSSQVPFSLLVIFHTHYCRKQMLRKRTLVGVLETPSCLKTRFCRVALAGHEFKIFQPLSLKGSDYRCILACSPHMTFLKVNGIKQGVSYTLYQTYTWTLWQCFFKEI